MASSSSSSFDREKAVYNAKLAEEAECYEDMVEEMKSVAKMGVELTAEERNLLSTAYHEVVWPRRDFLKKLRRKPDCNYQITRRKVMAEIKDICREVLSIIDDYLIPSCKPQDHINRVFDLKMKGDYFRYIAELTGPGWIEAAQQSLDAYEAARIIAKAQLPPTNPIRVGLELNYSVFYYTFDCSPERAIDIANQAFNEADLGLGSLNKEEHKDIAEIIMKLLTANIVRWESESTGDLDNSDNDEYAASI